MSDLLEVKAKPRNVLNTEEIAVFTTKLAKGKKPHIQKWVTSTFRRYLEREYPITRVVIEQKFMDSTIIKMISMMFDQLKPNTSKVLTERLYPVKASGYPDWVGKAIEANTEIHYVDLPWFGLNEDNEEHPFMCDVLHMLDFCDTLPERDIRMTFWQMQDAIKVWDKALAKQKILGSMNEGVEVVETQAFDKHELALVLVKLTTKQAYANEGAIMHHCVGGYFGKKGVEIYSLRTDTPKPLATIEVKLGAVVQVRGPYNKRIGDDLTALLKAWAEESKLKWGSASPDEDDEDEDEDEEEDEDEDEEEDEDEDDGDWRLEGE